MFRKTKPDNEIPNRRFNEINEARNIQKKKIFENNRYSNLMDEGQEDLVNLVSEDTYRQDNQEFTVVKATKRANQESNIHKSSYQTKAIFYSTFTGDSLHKYKDYKLIYKQLKQFKPNIHVKSAFLNKNNELVIQTDKKLHFNSPQKPADFRPISVSTAFANLFELLLLFNGAKNLMEMHPNQFGYQISIEKEWDHRAFESGIRLKTKN